MSTETTELNDNRRAEAKKTSEPNGFSEGFSELVPLIVEEYDDVDQDSLEKTGGKYAEVVALVANKTGRTRTRIKRELSDLWEVVKSTTPSKRDQLMQMLEKVQAKSNEVAGYVRQQMLEDAKSKVGDNPLVSLAMAVGLGFLLGFLLRGLASRDRS